MALNPSSPSHYSPSPLNRSTIPPRFHRPSLKLPFFCIPKLVSVRAKIPNSDSGNITSDPNIDCFGPKQALQCHGSETSSSPSASAIDFLTLCHSLKITKRKGWINHGIKGPESIADHMYRMALMALIAGDTSGVNRERCIKIAIVHDIAEAIVGDITPSDGVPKEEKNRMEQAALNEMCKVLGGGMRAEEIQELWAEYENNSSIEANLVKDFDKVEMILQALEYETGFGSRAGLMTVRAVISSWWCRHVLFWESGVRQGHCHIGILLSVSGMRPLKARSSAEAGHRSRVRGWGLFDKVMAFGQPSPVVGQGLGLVQLYFLLLQSDGLAPWDC